jgi:hypothetical protein
MSSLSGDEREQKGSYTLSGQRSLRESDEPYARHKIVCWMIDPILTQIFSVLSLSFLTDLTHTGRVFVSLALTEVKSEVDLRILEDIHEKLTALEIKKKRLHQMN